MFVFLKKRMYSYVSSPGVALEEQCLVEFFSSVLVLKRSLSCLATLQYSSAGEWSGSDSGSHELCGVL